LTARRGTTVSETLAVTVASGFHVNSNKPKDEFLIPLRLTWGAGPLQAKTISYPTAEQVKVGADTLDVYTGKFTVKTEFAVSQQASPGITMLEGKLRYQACDNVSCKRPATLTVQLPVSIQ
jgi:DsbC/DsbD-like thiol-disulfide interchange protein